MCNLHWCYTFCTGVTLFALVLHLNCTALSQSESSNFFSSETFCVSFVSATTVSLFARARKRHEQQCFRNNVSSFASTLRGEKLNYKSVANEISQPPFFGS